MGKSLVSCFFLRHSVDTFVDEVARKSGCRCMDGRVGQVPSLQHASWFAVLLGVDRAES